MLKKIIYLTLALSLSPVAIIGCDENLDSILDNALVESEAINLLNELKLNPYETISDTQSQQLLETVEKLLIQKNFSEDNSRKCKAIIYLCKPTQEILNDLLLITCKKNKQEFTQFLLQYGTTVTTCDKAYKALKSACTEDDNVTLEALLKTYNFDLNKPVNNDKKWTALHCATRYASVKCVQLLLKYGADKNAKSKDNITPLNIADYWTKVRDADPDHQKCLNILQASNNN